MKYRYLYIKYLSYHIMENINNYVVKHSYNIVIIDLKRYWNPQLWWASVLIEWKSSDYL